MNPSILSETWLTRHNIVAENQLQEGSIFSPQAVQFKAELYEMLVLPDRLQVMPTGPAEHQREVVVSTIGRIVELLPHTPYSAAGLNFFWEIRADDFAIYNRGSFGPANRAVQNYFNTPDCRFGFYGSRDALGVRLKLETKPHRKLDDPHNEHVGLYFNFHKDLTDGDTAQQINDLISIWDDAYILSRQITEALDQPVA